MGSRFSKCLKPKVSSNPNKPKPSKNSQYPSFEEISQSLDKTKINQLKHYDELLKKNPNNIEYISAKADICEKLGRTKEYLEYNMQLMNLCIASQNPNISQIMTHGMEYAQKIQECDSLNQQASSFHQLGLNDMAIDFYNKALERDYTYMPAMVNKIVLYVNSNQTQKAIDCAIAALRIDPECVDIWTNLATSFFVVGQKEKAIDFYNEALRINPNYFGAMNNLAVCYKDTGQKHRAVDIFLKIIELEPSAEAYNNLGLVYKEMGENKEQIMGFYDKAIKINPNFVPAWINKAKLLEDNNRYDEAIACFDKVIQIDPKNPKPWFSKGFILQEKKQYDKAIEFYDNAIKLDPTDVDSMHNKGFILYIEMKKFNEALELFNTELSIEPNNDKALILRAFVLQDLDRQDEAINDLNKVQSVGLRDLVAGLKFNTEVKNNLKKEVKVAEEEVERIIQNKDIAQKQPNLAKTVQETIKKIKTIKEKNKDINSEVVQGIMRENANTKELIEQLRKQSEIQNQEIIVLKEMVSLMKKTSESGMDLDSVQIWSVEVSYENKLLNHPDLLKKCTSNHLTPSKILDLSILLSDDLINVAIINQDYEMVLAGLMSVDNH